MAFAYCPDCAQRIFLYGKPSLGQLVTCDSCDISLEVVALNPPVLDWVDEESDWDEEPEREAA